MDTMQCLIQKTLLEMMKLTMNPIELKISLHSVAIKLVSQSVISHAAMRVRNNLGASSEKRAFHPGTFFDTPSRSTDSRAPPGLRRNDSIFLIRPFEMHYTECRLGSRIGGMTNVAQFVSSRAHAEN